MEFNKQNIHSRAGTAETHVIDEGLRAYMLKVYNYMASGIFLTGIIALRQQLKKVVPALV